jgi:hypothetical protein
VKFWIPGEIPKEIKHSVSWHPNFLRVPLLQNKTNVPKRSVYMKNHSKRWSGTTQNATENVRNQKRTRTTQADI